MSQKMKNKKHSRKQEESSPSDSENETDSSSSSSRESSPTPKKSKRESKKETEKDENTKHGMSGDERDLKRFKKQLSDDERLNRAKHDIVEQSKWDSPREKLERRDKKSERYRRSDSTERENFKSKSRIEKKQESEEYHKDHKYDRSREYSNNKNEERYRHDRRGRRYEDKEYQNERYERKDRRNDRDEYYKDKSRRERDSRMDENYSTKKYNYDKSNSNDQSRNRFGGHQSKYRNRNHRSRSRSLDPTDVRWGKGENDDKSKPEKSKEKPNFGLSGKLTEETNTYRGIVIKYSEPPEARKPKRRWRLYPFKGEKALQTLYIHRESAYLIGRERKIVDLPVDHPSCSKQHAVLQYRLVPFTREDGSQGKKVRPYLIDLDSANGTFINNKKIELRKYVELLEKDVIKFGYSSREYVLLHENSKDEAQDDDVKEEEVFEPVKVEKE